jgi:AcrR family transcriptional regulator
VTADPATSRPPRGSRRREILETFTRHVADRGYDGTNFAEIAAELGMSKGTIVHHFGTKDRMLRELQESYMRRRLAEAELIRARLSSPAEQLAALCYAFVQYQVSDRPATVAFQREVGRFAAEPVMSEVRRLQATHRRTVGDVLRAGMAGGEFRQGDVQLLSLMIFGSAQWAWTWYDPDGPRSADEIGGTLVDLVLGSLLVDRDDLGALADPQGRIPGLVRAFIREVGAVSGTNGTFQDRRDRLP